MQRKQQPSNENSSQYPPFFVVGNEGLTVMFSAVGPLLIFEDGEVLAIPDDLSSDEEQADFVMKFVRVGRA
jgi:hypothetical protein